MSKENKETNLRTLDQKEMGRRVRNRRDDRKSCPLLNGQLKNKV